MEKTLRKVSQGSYEIVGARQPANAVSTKTKTEYSGGTFIYKGAKNIKSHRARPEASASDRAPWFKPAFLNPFPRLIPIRGTLQKVVIAFAIFELVSLTIPWGSANKSQVIHQAMAMNQKAPFVQYREESFLEDASLVENSNAKNSDRKTAVIHSVNAVRNNISNLSQGIDKMNIPGRNFQIQKEDKTNRSNSIFTMTAISCADDDSCMAIINGKIVGQGDMVNENTRVIKITFHRVLIQSISDTSSKYYLHI